MTAQQIIMFAIQGSVIVTLFTFGLEATRGDLFHMFRHPGLLLRSFIAMFIVMPILAVAFATFFKLPADTEIALVCLSISPIPPLLPKKQDKAGGTDSYALGLMVTMALLSIAVIPIALVLLGSYFDKPFAMASGDIVALTLKLAIGPLAVGIIVRYLAPKVAARIANPLALAAGILLTLAGLVVLYVARHPIFGMATGGTFWALLAFIVVGLAVGHALGGPAREDRIVLALSTASRHPGIAIALASANYPDEHRVAAAVILYLLVSTVVSIIYMKLAQPKTASA